MKLIVGCICPKVHGKPFDILLLADRKVCPRSIIKRYIFYYYIRINGFFALAEWGSDSQMAGIFLGCRSKCNYRLSVLYGYAKENFGPLKQVLDTIEGTVKLIVGPVYLKVQGKPLTFCFSPIERYAHVPL